MKQIDVDFVVSDDSVNCYGYRLLSAGFMAEQYNPRIGYLMHRREDGVAVKWEELRVESDGIHAKPVVNDKRFPDLPQEMADGFYVGASVGGIVAVEWSDDASMKLAGQTGPTVTKWYCKEISIVDVPGNHNALAKLYDEQGSVLLDLSDRCVEDTPIVRYMNEVKIDPSVLVLLNLSSDATQEQVLTALRELAARAADSEKYKKQYDDLVALQAQQRVEAIVSEAVKEGKFFPAMAEHLKKHYAGQPEALQELVSTLPKQVKVAGVVEDTIPTELAGKSYQELFVSGELANVKMKYPKYYEKLEKEQAEKYGRNE